MTAAAAGQLALFGRATAAGTPARPAAARFTYYLGSRPNWLNGDHTPHNVPLFVSAKTLARYTSGPDDKMGAWDGFAVQTANQWALDSGAFTALTGREKGHPWHYDPDEYGGLVTRLLEDIGRPPDFAAPQDMPCEPSVLARTRLTVRQHCELTVENYLYLAEHFPFIPWTPVMQGWEPDYYLYCEQLYRDAGVDLAGAPRVGIGSICRRASVPGIVRVIEQFAGRGYRLHGFGVKVESLPVIGHLLTSADSYAWSTAARKRRLMLDRCDHRSRSGEPTDCRNCPRWAVAWREQVLAAYASGDSRGLLDLAA